MATRKYWILVCSLMLIATSVDAQCNGTATTKHCDPIPIKNTSPCGSGSSSEIVFQFAVIGDYGLASGGCEELVSDYIAAYESANGNLDFIITVGDNNYYTGTCDTFQANIEDSYGKYYTPSSSCVNPTRTYTANRFFPSLGNHDWDTYYAKGPEKLPYVQYFDYLKNYEPNNGLYYRLDPATVATKSGVVELFALNSNWKNTSDANFAAQYSWLSNSLRSSNATYKIVYFHHSPYSTCRTDPEAPWMRWDFEGMGASIVLSGHQHVYERIMKGNSTKFPYVINGLGGNPSIYNIDGPGCVPVAGSTVRYNKAHGFMIGTVTKEVLDFCFFSVNNGGELVDQFTIKAV